MTDIGLHRAERTRCPAWLLTLTKDLLQCGNLNGITQRSAGAMRLDIADAGRFNPGIGLGCGNHCGLSSDARGCVANFIGAIVVNGAAFDHSVDTIPIGARLVQRF